MKKGILGGTFDPVHNGHLAIAEEVMRRLDMDEVVFLPAGRPWLKKDREIAAAEHRLGMLKLALQGKPRFKICEMELHRSGDTYTIDTVAAIRERLGADDALYFIIGWDKVPELPRWKNVSRLIELCRLVAVPRPGYSLPDIEKLEKAMPGITVRLVFLDAPLVDVSASDIRRRLERGQPISGLVPLPVEKYIKRHSLYVK